MELEIVKFFNRLGKGRIDGITDFLSRVRYLFIFWLAVSAMAVFLAENRKAVVFSLAVVTLVHFLISEGVIKRTLTRWWGIRQRPYKVSAEIEPIGRQFSDSSFPSSHMASSLAMLTVLTYFFPSIWPVVLAFVLAMAFARLHNGMHYPSDILAGTFLGISYGALGIYAARLFF